jgi:hypothetical protein
MLGGTSVLVRPVTLRRMREPSGRQPSEIAPTQVPAVRSVSVDRTFAVPTARSRPLTCGAKGLEPLAFWMQTIFFAYFYVARCRLTSRLPAEIVEGRRRASPGVGLRWLFVWLF